MTSMHVNSMRTNVAANDNVVAGRMGTGSQLAKMPPATLSPGYPAIAGTEKQLVPIMRPDWVRAAVAGDLPLAPSVRESSNVDLKGSGLVGHVGQPAPVGRQHGIPLIESVFDEELRLAAPQAGAVAFHGRGP